MEVTIGVLRQIAKRRVSRVIQNVTLEMLLGNEVVGTADKEEIKLMEKVHQEIITRIEQ